MSTSSRDQIIAKIEGVMAETEMGRHILFAEQLSDIEAQLLWMSKRESDSGLEMALELARLEISRLVGRYEMAATRGGVQ